MVLAASIGIPRVPTYSGYCSACLKFRLRGSHLLWLIFPDNSAISYTTFIAVLLPQMINHLVWALSVSLAATMEIDFSFSSCSYLDVSVHCVLPLLAMYSLISNTISCIGFPHSDISGSLRTYRSPKHFAVCRVLLRLLVPRHSPCALLFLTLPLRSSLSVARAICFSL